MTREKVYFHMATMPYGNRIKSLEEVVPRILPQCDELTIYLNDFKEIPKFLIHHKIVALLSKDYHGDLGDVGKFFGCEKWKKGYHFTVDDDLLYPKDYAEKSIRSIEKYGRKAVVSAHARIFPNRKITSYYNDYAILRGCISGFNDDKFVHDIGTGAMAFHTDTLKLTMDVFERKNISDIYFAMFAQKNKIPLLNYARNAGWIKVSKKYDESYSICTTCIRDDKFQTSLINQINPWTIWTAPII